MIQSSIEALLVSLCRIGAVNGQPKDNKTKYESLISVFKSHVNNEMYKVLVAYVHLQATFEACLTKVFLVITLNV